MKLALLGAGLVGKAIARDLAITQGYDLIVYDLVDSNLKPLSALGIETKRVDLSNKTILEESISNHDIIIGSLPGFMGYETLQNIIKKGKDIVDISFFAEDPFTLDELARKNESTAIIDAGVAPGLSNILLGYADSQFDMTESFTCYVGGLPKARYLPFQYKAPFSPIDVLEEYTRPARMVVEGKEVIKPALSEREYIEFDEVGTLEAFNTDGLRTLIKTMKHIPDLKEKTLRYPGHIEKIEFLKEIGLFSTKEREIKGKSIRPFDLTSNLLVEHWCLEENEQDLTVMKTTIVGKKGTQKMEYSYYLYDEYDQENNILSMARTTGYTCTILVKMLVEGLIEQKGIIPPELIGKDSKLFSLLLKEYEKRNIHLKSCLKELNS